MSSPDIQQAAAAIARGGLVVYPTDTLWGLGAAVANEAAVRRVFSVKQRPLAEPLSIAVADVDAIAEFAKVTWAAKQLFHLLPGPLTLVLEKTAAVPDLVTGGRDHVGVRVPGHRDCLALLQETGPLTATSANRHGQADPRTLAEARAALGDQVDFYLDSPSVPVGTASTIVDARSDSIRIIRVGAIRESRIRELLVD